MSYQQPEWVEQMLSERWGRLVEDPTFKAPPQYVANNHPRDLAQEYLALANWAAQLEQELERTTAIVEALYARLAGATDGLQQQIIKSSAALEAVPSRPSG